MFLGAFDDVRNDYVYLRPKVQLLSRKTVCQSQMRMRMKRYRLGSEQKEQFCRAGVGCLQGGPLPVIHEVIAPRSRVIISLTHFDHLEWHHNSIYNCFSGPTRPPCTSMITAIFAMG